MTRTDNDDDDDDELAPTCAGKCIMRPYFGIMRSMELIFTAISIYVYLDI